MKTKISLFVLVLVALFATSCSKNEESYEPANNPKQTQWITYNLEVSQRDKTTPYTLEYLTDKGLQKISSRTGDFSLRVPAMLHTAEGTTFVRAHLSFKTFTSDGSEAPLINAAVRITGDNGFILAETYLSDNGCGNNERTVSEERPVSWLNIK